jgi:hypothetical protein
VNEFVQRHSEKVMGSMSGFDRLWFRGTLRLIASVGGLLSYMCYGRGGATLLKDFREWSMEITERVKQGAREAMEKAGRPVVYLNKSWESKESLAREIAGRDGIKSGPVCLLEAVEPCRTYEIHRDREKQRLELQNKSGKCLHQYAYVMDERVGLCHVRVQTWLPLDVRVSMNGREWLCRDLEKEGIEHVRQDNCVTRVARVKDWGRVQALLDGQLKTDWRLLLEGLVKRANPALPEVLQIEGEALARYWSLEQSEWATDVLFKEASELGRMYPVLARQAILGLGSADVMRFLGAPVSVNGIIPRNFIKEVTSDMKQRKEGMRVKHRVGNNSVKMYDKQARVLRAETTIHDPGGLRVYRGTEAEPEKKKWRACRKGVADLHRVAEIGEKSNQRYLSYLSKVECAGSVGELLGPLCRRVTRKGRGYRGLRPLEAEDGRLLAAVGRGEWGVNGFTNGQLRGVMYEQGGADKREERQRAARVSRQLSLLRAHGLVRKVSKTRRWMLTDKGREVITLVAAAKHASAKDLLQKAA